MTKLISLLIGLLLLTAGAAMAEPWPITYRLSGQLSGDYNGVAFLGSDFNLQVTANATDVTAVSWFDTHDIYGVGNNSPLFSGPDLTGTMFIEGVGQFTFQNRIYVMDSQVNSAFPGEFEIGTDLESTIIRGADSFFESYHLMTPHTSLRGVQSQVGYSSLAVFEEGGAPGTLTLTNASPLDFQAAGGVPEPSTIVLLTAGVAGLLTMRRKQKR